MSGSNGDPYRAPCGGWTGQLWIGSAHQHYRAADSHIEKHENTTTGLEITEEGGPGPYARTGGWGEPPPANTYAPYDPPQYANFATCWKMGFKIVYAAKAHHGMIGFGTEEDCCEIAEMSVCCPDEITSAPNTTKYLTRAVSTSFTEDHFGDAATGAPMPTTTHDRTITIDRYSGKTSVTGTDTIDGAEWTPETAADFFGGGNDGPLTSLNFQCGVYTVGGTPGEGYHDILTNVLNDVEAYNASSGHTAFDGTPDDHVEITDTSSPPTMLSFTIVRTLYVDFTPDPTWPGPGVHYLGTGWIVQTFTVTITLSGTYTGDDVMTDIVALLNAYDLTDDQKVPWRTDGKCTSGPYMTYFEKSPQKPNFFPDPDFIDTAPQTGEMLGAPNPAGYGPFFNFRMENELEAPKVGQSAPDWAFTATQWTGRSFSSVLPTGAFLSYNYLEGTDAGYLIAAKYAEIILPRPSHDYGRPWGRDRYVTEQSSERCVVDFTAGVVTLDEATSIVTGDICLYSINTSDGGVYQVTKLTDTTYALGTRIRSYPALGATDAYLGKLRWPDAPAIAGRVAIVGASNTSPIEITLNNFEKYAFVDTGDSVVISGCLGNTAANGTWTVTKTGAGTFTLDGSTGNGAYTNGGFAASDGAPDYKWHDNQRKGDYCIGTWEYDNRDWQEVERQRSFYATRSTRDDARASFGLEPCSNYSNPDPIREHVVPRALKAVTLDQHCASFQPCCPFVVCISPNGETFPNGYSPGFGTIACDDRYGAFWQRAPVQWMVDPLWQTPRKPCDRIDPWNEDAGDCGIATGTVGDFAQRPYEEFRAAPPDGAPTPADGIYYGCLSVDELNTIPVPPGAMLNPPQPGACFPAALTPWVVTIFNQLCIESAGDFACEYSDPENICDFEFDL